MQMFSDVLLFKCFALHIILANDGLVKLFQFINLPVCIKISLKI